MVGVELVPYRHTERIALAGMILLDVFVLLAGSLVARRAAGVALRPVADMTARLRTGAITISISGSTSARHETS